MNTRGTILLIDDNPDDIELAMHAFRISGIGSAVVIRQDGAQAIDYLRGPDPLPALVLLDINLPKVSGFEVLRTVRSEARTCMVPVVMLTTSREERDILKSYALGASSYIVKPLDFTEFTDVLRQIGTYWLILNQPAPQKEDAHAASVAGTDR